MENFLAVCWGTFMYLGVVSYLGYRYRDAIIREAILSFMRAANEGNITSINATYTRKVTPRKGGPEDEDEAITHAP